MCSQRQGNVGNDEMIVMKHIVLVQVIERLHIKKLGFQLQHKAGSRLHEVKIPNSTFYLGSDANRTNRTSEQEETECIRLHLSSLFVLAASKILLLFLNYTQSATSKRFLCLIHKPLVWKK